MVALPNISDVRIKFSEIFVPHRIAICNKKCSEAPIALSWKLTANNYFARNNNIKRDWTKLNALYCFKYFGSHRQPVNQWNLFSREVGDSPTSHTFASSPFTTFLIKLHQLWPQRCISLKEPKNCSKSGFHLPVILGILEQFLGEFSFSLGWFHFSLSCFIM